MGHTGSTWQIRYVLDGDALQVVAIITVATRYDRWLLTPTVRQPLFFRNPCFHPLAARIQQCIALGYYTVLFCSLIKYATMIQHCEVQSVETYVTTRGATTVCKFGGTQWQRHQGGREWGEGIPSQQTEVWGSVVSSPVGFGRIPGRN